jgi:hypothetical protein
MWDETPEQVAAKMVKANPDKAIDLTVYLIAELQRADLGEQLAGAARVTDLINEAVNAGVLSKRGEATPKGETVATAPDIITAGTVEATPPAGETVSPTPELGDKRVREYRRRGPQGGTGQRRWIVERFNGERWAGQVADCDTQEKAEKIAARKGRKRYKTVGEHRAEKAAAKGEGEASGETS